MYVALNEARPPGYSDIHQSRLTGSGGGVTIIYDDNLDITHKAGPEFFH